MKQCRKKPLLIAFLGCIAFSLFTTTSVLAEMKMKRLSEFQSGIFHLSPDGYPDSEFDKSDQYIDDEQADKFIAAARVDIYLPADHDNYPYSLVDHQITDDDLEIFHSTKGRSILQPYSRTLYLSRHNISLAQYTNMKRPPAAFMRKMEGAREPFHDELVQGVAWQYNNARIFQPEQIHRSVTPGEDCIRGYLINGEILTRRGAVGVWKTKHPLLFSCPPVEKEPTGRCSSCPETQRSDRISQTMDRVYVRPRISYNPCFDKPEEEPQPSGKCTTCP